MDSGRHHAGGVGLVLVSPTHLHRGRSEAEEGQGLTEVSDDGMVATHLHRG